MTTPFETAILKLQELGFFQFLLPLILSAAIFYGLLRKTQLFGPPEKNVAVNAVVAIVASFFIWAWPILNGVNIEAQFSAFFMQSMCILVITMVALIVAGMFLPPDLPKTISEKIKGSYLVGGLIVAGIIIAIILLITSGLSKVFFPQGIGFQFSGDTFTTIGMVVLVLAVVGIIVYMAR